VHAGNLLAKIESSGGLSHLNPASVRRASYIQQST
jgi:hypothetical protein